MNTPLPCGKPVPGSLVYQQSGELFPLPCQSGGASVATCTKKIGRVGSLPPLFWFSPV